MTVVGCRMCHAAAVRRAETALRQIHAHRKHYAKKMKKKATFKRTCRTVKGRKRCTSVKKSRKRPSKNRWVKRVR